MLSLVLKAEQRRIVSDAFLIMMLLLTPAIALLLRTYWPALDAAFPSWNIDQYKPPVSTLIALLTPQMMGLILGLNLLHDREQGMLTVVRTTPVGLGNYILVRSAGYFALSLLLTPALHELLGFVALPLWKLLVVCFFAQALLPLSTLILLNFAHNLVQGFAVMKASGGLITIPVVLAMFVPAPWYWLAAPLPTWWTLWGYFEIADGVGQGLLWLFIGAAAQLGLSLYLWRRLLRQTN
jgi:hypothetical protein